jgi:replicative DNA helicase
MSGSPDFPGETRIEAERKLLAALCQAEVDAETRAAIVKRLKQYSFAEPDHEVIFRALTGMGVTDWGDARHTLTEAVTRLGFPDMELAWLFSERAPTKNEVAALLERL